MVTGSDESDGKPISISLNLDRIYANRDELITGVSGNLRARRGRIETAEISGTFLSGQPVVFRVTPVDGGREMRINGSDGGAAIRAANLYSRVAGGQIEFYALLSNDPGASVKKGKLVLRNFRSSQRGGTGGTRCQGQGRRNPVRGVRRCRSRKLTLPFTSDAKFIRIGDSLAQGNELGASAEGLIRKSDGAVDITGTIIPIYALNSFISNIPIARRHSHGRQRAGHFRCHLCARRQRRQAGVPDEPGFRHRAGHPAQVLRVRQWSTLADRRTPTPTRCRTELLRLDQHVLLLAHRQLDDAIVIAQRACVSFSLSSVTA